jgi:hypothetical protein
VQRGTDRYGVGDMGRRSAIIVDCGGRVAPCARRYTSNTRHGPVTYDHPSLSRRVYQSNSLVAHSLT